MYKFINAIVIIDIIILLCSLGMIIYKCIFPTYGLGAWEDLDYFFRFGVAYFMLYILAVIHISIIKTEGNEIVSDCVNSLKNLGFNFNRSITIKFIQTLFFIAVFLIDIKFKYIFGSIPLWYVLILMHIIGVLTSFLFIGFFGRLQHGTTSFLLWIYTIIPIVDIKVLSMLKRNAENQETFF